MGYQGPDKVRRDLKIQVDWRQKFRTGSRGRSKSFLEKSDMMHCVCMGDRSQVLLLPGPDKVRQDETGQFFFSRVGRYIREAWRSKSTRAEIFSQGKDKIDLLQKMTWYSVWFVTGTPESTPIQTRCIHERPESSPVCQGTDKVQLDETGQKNLSGVGQNIREAWRSKSTRVENFHGGLKRNGSERSGNGFADS